MKIVKGLLDYTQIWKYPDVFLFTGNPVIKKDGSIVMGRGAAKMVRDAYNHVPYELSKQIQSNPASNLAWATIRKEQFIGWFKVKDHWKEPANPFIIQESVNQLNIFAESTTSTRFHMNYPGIGNGRLAVSAVEDIVKELSDNVFLYKGD